MYLSNCLPVDIHRSGKNFVGPGKIVGSRFRSRGVIPTDVWDCELSLWKGGEKAYSCWNYPVFVSNACGGKVAS